MPSPICQLHQDRKCLFLRGESSAPKCSYHDAWKTKLISNLKKTAFKYFRASAEMKRLVLLCKPVSLTVFDQFLMKSTNFHSPRQSINHFFPLSVSCFCSESEMQTVSLASGWACWHPNKHISDPSVQRVNTRG